MAERDVALSTSLALIKTTIEKRRQGTLEITDEIFDLMDALLLRSVDQAKALERRSELFDQLVSPPGENLPDGVVRLKLPPRGE